MLRWSIIAIGTTIAVIAVVLVLLNQPSRDLPSPHKPADTTYVESPAPAQSKPNEQKRPAAFDRAQASPSCNQVSESERTPVKPPVAQGPLKVLKGVYQDESRDPTCEVVERRIRSGFDPKTFPVERIHTVTCHKSVCKIGVFWSDKEPMVLAGVVAKVHPILTPHVAFEPVSEPDDKGDILVELYILREGHNLEDFE